MNEISITAKSGIVRYKAELTQKDVYHKELMKEEYVLISFISPNRIDFMRGDFIDIDFGHFELINIEEPLYDSLTGGFEYELKFYPAYAKWANRILKYYDEAQNTKETSFTLTQTPAYFLDLVTKNLEKNGFGAITYVFDASFDEMKTITFESVNIIDALTKIAEAWESEWWITDNNTIHLSKCVYGSSVDLAVGKALSKITEDDGKDTNYVTRLYAYGSEKNLPTNYRAPGGTMDSVVIRRLQLPEGIEYVDAWENMKDEDIVEGAVVVDNIFPRQKGEISSIATKQYVDKIEHEDGTFTDEIWDAYRFTDNNLVFKSEYRLPDQTLSIIFQSGRLAGMTFDVNFNPDGLLETNPSAQVFEIVRKEENGINLPSETLHPSVGDEYVFVGINTKLIDNSLLPSAENELLAEAKKIVKDLSTKKPVYTCDTNPVWCAGYRNNQWSQFDVIDLDVGQAVRVINYSGLSYESRVRAFEKHLDYKSECQYIVGEEGAYSRLGELNDKIDALGVQNGEIIKYGGNNVYLIKSHDKTRPSDFNAYSALRSRREFLSKNEDDSANGLINFIKGITFGKMVYGEKNCNIDGNGNADLLNAIIRECIHSPEFVDGMTGSGWQIWMDKISNLSNLTIDKVTIRQSLVAFELLIQKIRSVGGQIIVSAANGKIKEVTKQGDNYHITFEQENMFAVNDLMRCSVMSGSKMKDYWVEIVSSDADGILVPISEFGNVVPEVGDECVHMGNTQNVLRQNLIIISATEDRQPRIDILDNVNSKSFTDCLRCRLGNLDGIKSSIFPADKQPNGNGLFADNVFLKGNFILSNGQDVGTQLAITNEKLESAVTGLREDFSSDLGYLSNPAFTEGMNNWSTNSTCTFYLVGNKWIWSNNNILADLKDYSRVETDGSRKVVHIHNSFIKQLNKNFIKKPAFEVDPESGQNKLIPIYLSFYYKCTKEGTLTANFSGADVPLVGGEGFFYKQLNIALTDKYEQFTYTGLWNGTGDFRVAFTGDILISMLVLTTDKTEALAYKYQTLFEQSDRLVRLSAAVYDKNEECLKESGLVIKPSGSGMYAQDAEGNLALIGVTVTEGGKSKVMLTADNIQLEGLITANNNFKILTDGTIEATNGKFNGMITCIEGTIGGFEIGNDHIGMAKGGKTGSLSIYKDYFRVGGYALIGNNVSSSTNAAKTIAKIYNEQFNDKGYNYGLTIDVQYGVRNFGIYSNAPILAPSVITTVAQIININPTHITPMDLSQYSVFLLFSTEYLNVPLPDELEVTDMFGYQELPTSFAVIFTLKIRQGSQRVNIKDVYDSNEGLGDRPLSAGDSLTLMCSKVDGFRYNVINLQN